MRLFIFLLLGISSFIIDADCTKANDSSSVVVAGGSITEIIYFIGKEKKLVGVDITSNFPSETSSLPSIGYVRNLSTEGILSLKPTLILGESDMGPPLVLRQLSISGVDSRIIDETYSSNGILKKLECISSILGLYRLAELQKFTSLKKEIATLETISNLNRDLKIKVMLILTVEGMSPIIAGRGTSGDGFIKLTGATNVATSFEGWKPVSTESIIQFDPDFIIITDRGLNSFKNLKNLSNSPSLKYTRASRNDKIFAEDGMAMLGFGVRTIETALKFARIFNK